jgi:hypothetical protein
MKSLANTEQFPKYEVVMIQRKMFVWNGINKPSIQKIQSWCGHCFVAYGFGCYEHACEIPSETEQEQKKEHDFGVRVTQEDRLAAEKENKRSNEILRRTIKSVSDADCYSAKELIDIENKRADENSFVRNGVRSDAELASCSDAQVWAKEFCERNTAIDKETMTGWFANAIMAGYDHALREKKAKEELCAVSEPKTRPMTECEILRLGSALASFDKRDGEYINLVTANDVINDTNRRGIAEIFDQIIFKHCPYDEMTDEHPRTWAWRELTKECE